MNSLTAIFFLFFSFFASLGFKPGFCSSELHGQHFWIFTLSRPGPHLSGAPTSASQATGTAAVCCCAPVAPAAPRPVTFCNIVLCSSPYRPRHLEELCVWAEAFIQSSLSDHSLCSRWWWQGVEMVFCVRQPAPELTQLGNPGWPQTRSYPAPPPSTASHLHPTTAVLVSPSYRLSFSARSGQNFLLAQCRDTLI